MNDYELLVMAAKAVNNGCWHPLTHEKHWNPLTDDGDALRLAASLGIHIAFYGDHIAVQQTKTKMITVQARDGDMFGATRRAIVRAAAEIGKAMQ